MVSRGHVPQPRPSDPDDFNTQLAGTSHAWLLQMARLEQLDQHGTDQVGLVASAQLGLRLAGDVGVCA
jgi:hypothetical protein